MKICDPKDSPVCIDVRRVVLRTVVLPLAMMAIVAGCLAWQVERLSSTAMTVDRAGRVIAQANKVQKLILDKETGLRGFLIRRNRLFLEPYEQAHPGQAIDELSRLVSGNPAQMADVEALRARYRAWQAEAALSIDDPAPATSVDGMVSRKADMDAMRALVATIIDDEEAVRVARTRAVEKETRMTAFGSALLLTAVGGTLSMVSRRKLRQIADTYEDALARRAASEADLAKLVAREQEAREKAQEALRAKDEFLSTLSHELRTPLTAILGWSGVLRARKAPVETVSRALASIERNARAQAQIVEDILDVSRIVAGKFQLHLASMDVAAVVRAALDVVRFSAESKGVALDAALDPEPIRMVGDADRLQQVVWNLIGNAVKFTPKGGRVLVCVDRAGSRVRIRVSDSGEGIAPEFLPHVFERFRQADSSLKRPHGGLGLGLAIVKHLVDMHGGEVWAESAGPGRGAVFTVTLPIVAVDAALPCREAEPRPASLAGIRALVVDDDPDSLAVLVAILREHGAEVKSAASGAAALAVLARGSVDVIVSDIGMPGLDGYELLQKIREAPAPAPVLALTAYARPEEVERALLAGFHRHLAKPVTPEHLVEVVAGLVRVG